MISETAMEDIARLRADGLEVPPREIVRLNALGLKVERGVDSAELFAAPRVSFVGKVVFHEPTLGAEMWLRQTMDAFDEDDEETFFSLRVLSCLLPWRELPDPTKPRDVRKAVTAVFRTLRDITYRQVLNALDWCLHGNAQERGENPPPKEDDKEAARELPERYAPEFGLFYRGVAARVGTAEEIKDLTYSAILHVCERAEQLETASAFGGADRKAEKNKATGDYFRTLDAIREAAEAAKADEAEEAEEKAPEEGE